MASESQDGFPYGRGVDLASEIISVAQKDADGLNINRSERYFVSVPEANSDEFRGIPIITSDGVDYAFGREAAYVGLQHSSPLLKAADVISTPADDTLGRAVATMSSAFLDAPRTRDEYVYFSVPTSPVDVDCVALSPEMVATRHSAFYLREIARRGQGKYRPLPMPSGQAIVLDEALAYTGVGISFDLSFVNMAIVKNRRLLRVVTQSRAGEYIINQTALETGKSTDFIKAALKVFDPTSIKNGVDETLRFYYRAVMDEVLDHLDTSFLSLQDVTTSYEMIWAGVMTSVKSFADLARERFNLRSLERTFSGTISGQRRGKTPLQTVVSGLYWKAHSEHSL